MSSINRKLTAQPIEFVTFHVSLGSDEPAHPNKTLEHQEYQSMINMMFASAELFHTNVKTTVLTDKNTKFGGISTQTTIVHFDIDANKLMLERAKAQLSHIQNGLNNHPMIILDSDILMNASIDSVFQQDFDIAVTWRRSSEMPINGGFIILNNIRPAITQQFFQRYVDIYEEKYADKAVWFGDQLALHELIGMNHKELQKNHIVEVDGCRVLLLPCDTYNFSPENQYKEICSNLSDKVVLHFKGERKHLMHHFWTAWTKPNGSYSPWVLFNAWRKHRWLQQQAILEQQTEQAGNQEQ